MQIILQNVIVFLAKILKLVIRPLVKFLRQQNGYHYYRKVISVVVNFEEGIVLYSYVNINRGFVCQKVCSKGSSRCGTMIKRRLLKRL
jgi:hypothetical protein